MADSVHPRRLHPFGAIALLAVLAVGCSDQGARMPTNPVATAPVADSPQSALRVFEWCWNQREIEAYSGLFTADFRFQFGVLDPYGIAYRDNPWGRDDEIISLDHLFNGSPDKPAASSIALTLDRNFIVQPDPRPGKDPRWHKAIRTSVFCRVVDADQVSAVATGYGLFFLVRGDSAAVSPEMLDLGSMPDSTGWFIERWEDEPIVTGMRSMPTRMITMGQIKALYR